MHRPPLPPGNIPGTHFCQRLSRPQGHSAAGRIMSMKNSNDTIGNRTRDLPACSAVPQPTAPPRAPIINTKKMFNCITIPCQIHAMCNCLYCSVCQNFYAIRVTDRNNPTCGISLGQSENSCREFLHRRISVAELRLPFLGASAEFRKVTISFVMSVFLSACLLVSLSAQNSSAFNGWVLLKLFVPEFYI